MPPVCAIIELKENEEGGYTLRGGARLLWSYQGHECVLSGPAETGKTVGALLKLDALLWKYAGAQGVMARKTYAALVGSALQTYKRIIGERSPIKAYGGEKPEWFQYPNGSRLWLAGLDNPGKSLSSERDFIYINQVEELDLTDYETLTTRCTGRAGNTPYPQIFGDCNPAHPQHWILHRPSLKLFESRHEDNPALFDDNGGITEQGKLTLSILDNLTGVRYLRLRKGKWVQAEGVVYEEWDRAVHVIPRFPIPAGWSRQWIIDFGFTNPFCFEAQAIDPDGRIIVYHEIYETQKLVSDHAKAIKKLTEGEPKPEKIICDHDAEDRATIERELGMGTIPAYKAISPGIQAVQQRLRIAGDGKPRFMVMEGSLVRQDQNLVAAKHPTSSIEEVDMYIWPKGQDGKTVKEVPVDLYNHGMDVWRYGIAERDLRSGSGGPPSTIKIEKARNSFDSDVSSGSIEWGNW